MVKQNGRDSQTRKCDLNLEFGDSMWWRSRGDGTRENILR